MIVLLFGGGNVIVWYSGSSVCGIAMVWYSGSSVCGTAMVWYSGCSVVVLLCGVLVVRSGFNLLGSQATRAPSYECPNSRE